MSNYLLELFACVAVVIFLDLTATALDRHLHHGGNPIAPALFALLSGLGLAGILLGCEWVTPAIGCTITTAASLWLAFAGLRLFDTAPGRNPFPGDPPPADLEADLSPGCGATIIILILLGCATAIGLPIFVYTQL